MAAQHIDFNTDLRFDWHSMIIQSDRDKVVDFIHKAVRPSKYLRDWILHISIDI